MIEREPAPERVEPRPAFDLFRFVREEVRFEHGQIASRTASFIGAQAFLVTAFAITFANRAPELEELRCRLLYGLPLLGLVIAVFVYIAVISACQSLARLHQDQERVSAGLGIMQPMARDRARYRRSQWYPQLLPWIFAAFWTGVTVLVVVPDCGIG